MQAQIIRSSPFDFCRVYSKAKAAPAKTTQAQPVKTKTVKTAPAPAKKAVRVILKETVQPAPEITSTRVEITTDVARPHLLKITPIAKIAPIPKVAPLPKIAPLPANCAAYTPETIRAEIDGLNKRLAKAREGYAKHGSNQHEKDLLLIKSLLKTACFIRSKIAPIPTLPKIKTVTVTGYCESVYHGTDAQILVHLRNMAKSQRVASKEGLPFEGMKMVVTHN